MSKEAVKFDLHCHTFFSDGVNSPREMLQKANDIGLDYLAISDHNTTDGVIDLIESGDLKYSYTKLIPATEFSTITGHYLILGVNPYTLKRQMEDNWKVTKGGFADFVSYRQLIERLTWSINRNAYIITAHPCMPSLLMSTTYATLVDLNDRGLIHGAENYNHDVQRHYGLFYGLYQKYVDGILDSLSIPKFANSDAHHQDYLGYYYNTANANNSSFIKWLETAKPFIGQTKDRQSMQNMAV